MRFLVLLKIFIKRDISCQLTKVFLCQKIVKHLLCNISNLLFQHAVFIFYNSVWRSPVQDTCRSWCILARWGPEADVSWCTATARWWSPVASACGSRGDERDASRAWTASAANTSQILVYIHAHAHQFNNDPSRWICIGWLSSGLSSSTCSGPVQPFWRVQIVYMFNADCVGVVVPQTISHDRSYGASECVCSFYVNIKS